MAPRHNRSPLQPKHNRSNTPVHINDGLAAKQRGEDAVESWRFAKNLTIRDPSQTMMTIGRATNTHIVYDGRYEFRFWGSPENKIQPLAGRQQLSDPLAMLGLKQWQVSNTQHGSFLWPSEEEYRPEEALGHRNFELLNPIRRENNCVIDYDSSRSSFIVKGGTEDVQQAILRIRGLLCKTVAQRSAVQRLFLIQNECQKFTLTDHPPKMVWKAGTVFKQGMKKTVKSVGARQRPEDVALNAKRMKDLVIQTLSKVHWHQGFIDLRAHLGTLILEHCKPFEGNTKTLAEYKEMIEGSYDFHAKVTEELGDKVLEDSLLLRFLNATNWLNPCDRFARNLADTKPEYTASIEVDIKDGEGNLLITKRWHEENGSFSSSNPEFKRVIERTGRTRFLEVYMSDTLSNLTWLLDISALGAPQSSRLPDWAKAYGEYYINLNPDKARMAESFCEFETYEGKSRPLAHKRAIREKIVWRFELKAPYAGYEVEVAKVFNKKFEPCLLGGREPVTLFEERWTVDVKHRQWSNLLSENHELRAGISAEWKADIQSWFPVESTDTNEKLKGHVELLHVLQRVQDIVLGKSS
ncbi:hypothetical protein E4T45_09337 [Aureobasidium sp. EXF-8846]|nr:hypothetical protein E4T45_09337 [Aureobasidium sp. EXF-8846]